MSIVAIITARGNSKRIPRKNIKDFLGKPMLAYAITSAISAGIFDEVMVSTDDEEIAQIARQYGAQVPFMRSEKTSNDYAVTFDVVDEVVTQYQKQGKIYDAVCCIYPCVPFLKATTLQNAYKKLEGHDAVIPVCKYPVPIEWAMKLEKDILVPYDHQAQQIRSQDIVPKYYDAGMFYFCRTKSLYERNSLVPFDTTAYIMDEMECQDIDTPADWEMAEMKYKVLHHV